jgi:hypothetical protein
VSPPPPPAAARGEAQLGGAMLDAVPGCCAARDVGAARPFDYGVHTLLLLQAVARPHSVPKGTGPSTRRTRRAARARHTILYALQPQLGRCFVWKRGGDLLTPERPPRPHAGDDSLLHAYKRDMSDAYGSGLPAGFSVPASFIPELEQKRERT